MNLAIVDLYGHENLGHHAEYNRLVFTAALFRGFDDCLLLSRAAQRTQGLPEAVSQRTLGHGTNCCVLTEALEELSGSEFRIDDHVLVPTLNLQDLEHCLEHFCQYSALTRGQHPRVHVVLRFDPQELFWDERRSWNDLCHSFGAIVRGSSPVSIYSDTEPLVHAWSRLFQAPVGLLPVPVDPSLRVESQLGHEWRVSTESTHGVFLGDARPEKGIESLLDAIPKVRRLLRGSHASWSIQAHLNVAGGELDTSAALDKFRARGDVRVSLIDRPLAREDYNSLLRSADFAVLPYATPEYSRRSSSVLAECMIAGVPVVTTQGTWLATEVTALGFGVVADRGHLAEGIVECIQRMDDFRALAPAVRRSWDVRTSSLALIDCLLDDQAPDYVGDSERGEHLGSACVGDESGQTHSGGCLWTMRQWSHVSLRLLGRSDAVRIVTPVVDGEIIHQGTSREVGDFLTFVFSLQHKATDAQLRHISVSEAPQGLGPLGTIICEAREEFPAEGLWRYTDARTGLFPPERALDETGFCWTRAQETWFEVPVGRLGPTVIECRLATWLGEGSADDPGGFLVIPQPGVEPRFVPGHVVMIPVSREGSSRNSVKFGIRAIAFGQASESDPRLVGVALETVTWVQRRRLDGVDGRYVGDTAWQ